MSGKVRIIGGHLRGRVLKVIDHQGLRPTTDRVRETLFNWLGQRLDGKICVDVFAGSGALGFEALSRGAAKVLLNELATPVAQALHNNYAQFSGDTNLGECEIFKKDAIQFLKALPDQSVDICFIDPPFSQTELFKTSLEQAFRITRRDVGSAIYLEHPKGIDPNLLLSNTPEMNPFWTIGRTIRSGMATGVLFVPQTR
jgi:16S rRNA (guanine(966)-N(2))-methyltransferase RsmD